MMNRILFIFLISMIALNNQAQNHKNFELGLQIGASAYNGDLSHGGMGDFLEDTRPALGLFGKIYFDNWIAGRLNLTIGKLVGDDDNGGEAIENRNLDFRSPLVELSTLLEFHPFAINRLEQPTVSPYFIGGLALFRFNPKADINGTTYNLQELGTEGQGIAGNEDKYNRIQPALIFGAGIRFQLKNDWALMVEVAPRYTFTDHLDDVSNQLVDYNQLISNNGQAAADLSNRNPDFDPSDANAVNYIRGGEATDWYYIATIGISKTFGSGVYSKGVGCPNF